MTQQPPSSVASSETGSPTSEMLAEITSFLAGRNLYGLVWCDEDLVATHIYGQLAEFVPLGSSICSGELPLMGFEEQIRALRRLPDTSVVLPDISVRHAGGTTPKININVYWLPRRKAFLVVISRVQKELVQELTRQIRARRMADDQLAQKSEQLDRANRELTRANDDLEEFAYVISHDLNAPLRAMRYLTGDLEQSLGSSDSAAAQLAQLKTQSQRMSAMLTGLFEYASLGQKDEAIAQVDTADLIAQIIASLPADRQIEIVTSGQWPTLNTLEQPLDLVLRNLIENAIKHHDRDVGLVEVSASETDTGWQFSITDDGPGIPPGYAEAIFRPFLKVDGDANPDSSGVGLAIVRKTVEGIGGSIECLARPDGDRGSVFRVMWPRVIST